MSLLVSCLCTQKQLESEPFVNWLKFLEPHMISPDGKLKVLHRKLWEMVYVAQALDERGMLQQGKKGLAFAVGQEMLPSLFASRGCEILATDLGANEAQHAGWIETNQHAASVESLQRPNLCDPELFRSRVKFRPVNMNQIPSDLRDFDFCWSTCSFEHLGSIGRGQRFIMNMLDCLKPGGVAVHTTEYNVYSNTRTVSFGGTVIFRRRDIEAIVKSIRALGHKIDLHIEIGDQPADQFVDIPPYKSNPHLKLQLASYVVTSIGLIIEKNSSQDYRTSISTEQLYKAHSMMQDAALKIGDGIRFGYRQARKIVNKS